MNKDLIKVYKEIIKAHLDTIESLLEIIQSQEKVIATVMPHPKKCNNDPETDRGESVTSEATP